MEQIQALEEAKLVAVSVVEAVVVVVAAEIVEQLRPAFTQAQNLQWANCLVDHTHHSINYFSLLDCLNIHTSHEHKKKYVLLYAGGAILESIAVSLARTR